MTKVKDLTIDDLEYLIERSITTRLLRPSIEKELLKAFTDGVRKDKRLKVKNENEKMDKREGGK